MPKKEYSNLNGLINGPQVGRETLAAIPKPSQEAIDSIAKSHKLPAEQLRVEVDRACEMAFIFKNNHNLPPENVLSKQIGRITNDANQLINQILEMEEHAKLAIFFAYHDCTGNGAGFDSDFQALERLALLSAKVAREKARPGRKGKPRTADYKKDILHHFALFWFRHKESIPGCSNHNNNNRTGWIANPGGDFVLKASALVLSPEKVKVSDLRQAQTHRLWPKRR